MKKFWINLCVSLAVGALFVWLAIRGVDWVEVKDAFSHADVAVLVGYFLILGVIEVVRIVRWGILLRPLGKVSFAKLFGVGSVGIMALILLPLRLGEFARPILIAERGKIRISAALATVVVERVVDSLAMATLLMVLLFFLEGRLNVPAQMHSWACAILAVFLLFLAFLVLACRRRESTVVWFRRLVAHFSTPLADRLASILRSFIGGIQALPDVRLLAVFLLLTVVYWGMSGAGMLYMFSAFDGLRSLGWIEAFTILSLLCVGLMIPAGPGMIGNFHYFIKLGLSLFVSDAVLGSAGVAYTIMVHAMQLGQQVLFGVPFLFSSHISPRRLISAPTEVSRSLGGGDAGHGE